MSGITELQIRREAVALGLIKGMTAPLEPDERDRAIASLLGVEPPEEPPPAPSDVDRLVAAIDALTEAVKGLASR